MAFVRSSVVRSIVARLLAPVGIMLALVFGMQVLNGAIRAQLVAADELIASSQARALELSELRSISRALQRDALNLVTETNQTALREIRQRFDKRRLEFQERLNAIARQADTQHLSDYAPTQTQVLTQLDAVRRTSDTDRSAALVQFQATVRPAERHASQIADTAIEQSLRLVDVARVRAAELQVSETRELTIATMLLTALAVGTALWLIVSTVLRPLRDIGRAMETLASGNAAGEIPHATRADEIGQMARSIEVFRTATLERDRLLTDRVDNERRQAARDATEVSQRTLEAQRKELLTDLASSVESSLAAMNDRLRASAARLSRSADAVTDQAREAAAEAERTTAQASGAADDLLAVASASAQLTDTVSQLRTQTGEATDAIGRAAARSQQAGSHVAALTVHADRVSGMAETIRAVASRSRLLALNATIEAARVGEAGRGFAVVAGEMKTMADQTEAVTREVEEQTASIRDAAGEAVVALQEINSAVVQITRDATSVNEAMVQQGAAGNEIGEGMETALTRVRQVAAGMADLRRVATTTGAVAGTLQTDAIALAADAGSVDMATRDLISRLRAA